jgi:hypothetical protein
MIIPGTKKGVLREKLFFPYVTEKKERNVFLEHRGALL